MSGPFAVLMSLLSEFHGKKYRDRIMLFVGMSCSLANTILPLIASVILPFHWHLVLINNFIGKSLSSISLLMFNFLVRNISKLFFIVLHSWHIFLFIAAIPTILSLILVSLFPESPKFLMSRGRNDEALAVFQSVFSINTGRPKNEYPVIIFFLKFKL